MDNRIGIIKRICSESGAELSSDKDLSTLSTIGIGGEAEAVVYARGAASLESLVALSAKADIYLRPAGNGSNTLFPDEGFPGVIVKLDRDPSNIKFEGNSVVVGGGVLLGVLIKQCCSRGLSGLEWLTGIPATVGGAVANNASYVDSISSRLRSLTFVGLNGETSVFKKEEIEFGYRYSSLRGKGFVAEVEFELDPASTDSIRENMESLFADKLAKQPMAQRTLGCVFKNPVSSELSSGAMIDRAGLKGFSIGGAVVSDKHANFIVNSGGATAGDVISLIEHIRGTIYEMFSVELEPEIEIIPAKG